MTDYKLRDVDHGVYQIEDEVGEIRPPKASMIKAAPQMYDLLAHLATADPNDYEGFGIKHAILDAKRLIAEIQGK